MVSRNDSVAIGNKDDFPIDVRQWPRLRFRFRVGELPKNTDLRKKATDDAAFRIFIAFDRGKGLFGPPHTIGYAWTRSHEPGQVITSGHFKNMRYVSIGKGMPAKPGEWITIERDLATDYRLVFPEAKGGVPALAGVLLKCDSNHTRSSASSEVAFVELLPPG